MPPRFAYFGTDRPDPMITKAQALAPSQLRDPDPGRGFVFKLPGEQVAEAQAASPPSGLGPDVEAMIARQGGTLKLPDAATMQNMTPAELQNLFKQVEQYAATDGDFQMMEELAQEWGMENPYPDPSPLRDSMDIDPVAEDTRHMFDQATVERLARRGGSGDAMVRAGTMGNQEGDLQGTASALASRALGQATSQDEVDAAERFNASGIDYGRLKTRSASTIGR